jgi:hypothetical protein
LRKVNDVERKDGEIRKKIMTVCIAAISESQTKNPKIVFASDRLVSAGVCFEGGVSKIHLLSQNAWVMSSSNDALASDGIILKIQKALAKNGTQIEIEQIATLFSQECKNKLKSEKEKQVFLQYGLTENNFMDKSSSMSDLIVKDILDRSHEFKYEFEVEFLLIGFDSEPYVPHIYTINGLGDIQVSDHLGFATIGSGQYLAFPEMTKYAYHTNTGLSEAIMRVYWSKKAAERVGGVGKATDLLVLHVDSGGIRFWEAQKEHKDVLDKGLEEIRAKEIEISISTIDVFGKLFRQDEDAKETP